MFEPLRPYAASLAEGRDSPRREALQRLVSARGVRTAGGAPLRLVAPQPHRRRRPPAGAGYEARIYMQGEIEVRERNVHDIFNVLAWLAYPLTKAELNRLHWEGARDQPGGAGRRGAARDALTLFDENGAIVVASEADLLDDVRAFRWKELFWKKRERVKRALRVSILGHALLEKAMRPYVGMCAHALLFSAPAELVGAPASPRAGAVDALVASFLREPGALSSPRALTPLPVLGVPGWWPPNASEQFYDDTRYFRTGRRPLARDVSG
jgi:hypothetical protein